MIRAYMTANNTRVYVDHLPVLVSSYNSIPHTTTGVAPSDLLNNAEKRAKALVAIQTKAVKKIKGSRRGHPMLVIGDTVRVAKTKSSGLTRGAIKWSKDTYTVVNVSKPSNEWSSPVYTLDNNHKYTRDRLQKISLDNLVRIPTRQEATRANVNVVPQAQPVLRAPSQRVRRPNITLRTYEELIAGKK